MAFTPYDAAKDTITRARALLNQAQAAGVSTAVRGDMRRLAVVLAVTALDTYMHRLIVSRAYEHDTLPGGLANLSVPFEALIEQADAAVLARKENRNIRPKVPAKRVLRDRLLRETFQRYDDVARALSMAGRPRGWTDTADAMWGVPGVWTPEELKAGLNAVVDRRNRIVHEGDYERLERPQTAKLTSITAAQATRDVDFLADVIDAIHSIV